MSRREHWWNSTMDQWGIGKEPITQSTTGEIVFEILSSDQAFAKVPNEVSIPIDTTQHDFQFTRHWFRNRNQATWSTYLKPMFGDGRPVRMIQIGVFEGADLVWCCQNLLTHPDSKALAIDPWLETTKLDQTYMTAVENRARHNLLPWSKKVSIF